VHILQIMMSEHFKVQFLALINSNRSNKCMCNKYSIFMIFFFLKERASRNIQNDPCEVQSLLVLNLFNRRSNIIIQSSFKLLQ